MVSTSGHVGVSAKITEDDRRDELKEIFQEGCREFDLIKKCRDISYGAIIRTCAKDAADEEIKHELMVLFKRLDEALSGWQYKKAYAVLIHKAAAYISDTLNYTFEDAQIVTDDLEIYNEFLRYFKENGVENREIVLYNDGMISLENVNNISKLTSMALSKKVFLKSGAYLVIEPTEAMTVIDVNTGKAVKGKNSDEHIFKINIEAAEEIARQLRLRNLSGIIVIDFISMKDETYNRKLLDKLSGFTSKDVLPVKVVDITKLGLVELTRKKVRKPLHQMLM